MSEILIKGMEMPKHLHECPMRTNCPLVMDGCFLIKDGEKRHNDCPLVEVPTHGDWHTGTPVEDGWYLLECNIGNSDETYYVTDHWNNEVGYWTVNRVIRWQKIEP